MNGDTGAAPCSAADPSIPTSREITRGSTASLLSFGPWSFVLRGIAGGQGESAFPTRKESR